MYFEELRVDFWNECVSGPDSTFQREGMIISVLTFLLLLVLLLFPRTTAAMRDVW